eukprot:jgi/Psemu1/23763/gm1.23763_g
MLYIQMLALLTVEGCQLLLSQQTSTKVDNQSRKCEEEIDGHIYAIELMLGFPRRQQGVLNLDKMVVHFINCINNYLQQSKGEGNNLMKNHMYSHLSQYMRLFGAPTGWDSAASESNHKTELKAPAKRTQQIKSTLIKQTCKRLMEYSGLKLSICVMNGLPYTKKDKKKNASVPWFPLDAFKFCCNVVLLAAGTNTLCGSPEHKRYDNYRRMGLLFCAHPLFKSDSGQLPNVWYDWANFQLDLLEGRGLQVYPCQIPCLLHLEGPFPPAGSSVSRFELVHGGYYAIACCFLSVDPISSKREKDKRHHHALVKQGELQNKLYLFDCNVIESDVAVVRNLGRKYHYFVLRNRE